VNKMLLEQEQDGMTEEEFESILEKESQLFEDELNSQDGPQDAKERLRLRHLHYQKQLEKRLERMRALGTLAKKKEREGVSGSTLSRIRKKCNVDFLHEREFEAHGVNKTYRGPLITPMESESLIKEQTRLIEFLEKQDKVKMHVNGSNGDIKPRNNSVAKTQYAVFLGEDGTLYDKFYLPILGQDPEHLNSRGKLSKVREEGLMQKFDNTCERISDENQTYLDEYEFCYDPELYESIPTPYSFATFEEYEQALINWGNTVKDRLGYLQLPIVTGRHYFRPNASSQHKGQVPAKNKRDSHMTDSGLLDHPSALNLLDTEETWESSLIPLEPKPEFYDTFEEFEKAMIRWTIASIGLNQLPPHPAQFQKLLGLRIVDPPFFPIAEVNVDTLTKKSNDAQETYKSNKAKSRAKEKSKRRFTDIYHTHGDNEDHLQHRGSNEWSKLKENDKQQIRNAIQNALNMQMQKRSKFKVYHTELLPRIHGIISENETEERSIRRLTLTHPLISSKATKSKANDPIRKWIECQRKIRLSNASLSEESITSLIAKNKAHQIPLRRNDLTEEQLKEIYDCQSKEKGKRIEFEIPQFDLGTIEFNLLSKDWYISLLQYVLKGIEFGFRHYHLNSWYFPTLPASTNENQISELAKLFVQIQHPTQIDDKLFYKLFTTDAFLDNFEEFMDRYMKQKCFIKGNKEISIFHELLHYGTTSETLASMLKLFDLSHSSLAHAKLAYYVVRFLESERCKEVLLKICKDKDTNTLYYLAVAATFFEAVPVQFFRYTRTMQELIKNKFESRMNDLICTLVATYYLECICIALWEEDSRFPDAYPLMIQQIESNVLSIATYLKNNPNYIKYHIWDMVGSRSRTMSELGIFIANFLFSMNCNTAIVEMIKSKEVNVVEKVRKLARSKLSHVTAAASKIFATLEKEDWRCLLVDTYCKANNIVEDMLRSTNKTIVGSQPPVMSPLVYKFLEDSINIGVNYEKENKSKKEEMDWQIISSLLEEDFFHMILLEITTASRERRVHQGVLMGAMFLAKFAKYTICNQMIAGEDEKKKVSMSSILSKLGRPKKKDSPSESSVSDSKSWKLSITASDLNNIIEVLFNENTKSRQTYSIRKYMLETLRHLIKCPSVFALLNLDKHLLARIQEMCEDSFDVEFNREAWRLFYQMIKFHAGVIEKLIKENMVANFLEPIGNKIETSPIISKNSIHYFNKIFNLPENSTPFTGNKKDCLFYVEPKKNARKTGFNVPQAIVMEKYAPSVRALCDHILLRQLHIIFYIAFTRLFSNYKGWAFQSLAQLYHTLDKHSSCVKIAQKFRSHKEYKEALDLMNEIIMGKKD